MTLGVGGGWNKHRGSKVRPKLLSPGPPWVLLVISHVRVLNLGKGMVLSLLVSPTPRPTHPQMYPFTLFTTQLHWEAIPHP